MYTIYPLFSSPVYSSTIDSLSAKNINHITTSKFKRTPNNDGNISLDIFVLDSPELKELRFQIFSHINAYIYDTLRVKKNIKVKLLNSWAMQHLPKDYALPHTHGNSLFSGVVYIKTSKGCGDIVFMGRAKDNFSETITLEYEEFNIFNGGSWFFEPSDGLILLFPSHLTHQILPNLSDDSRYCVAFNIFVEGELGDFGTINTLSLK